MAKRSKGYHNGVRIVRFPGGRIARFHKPGTKAFAKGQAKKRRLGKWLSKHFGIRKSRRGKTRRNPQGYGKAFVLGKKMRTSGGLLRYVSGSYLVRGEPVPAFVRSPSQCMRFATRMEAEHYRQNFRGAGLKIYRRA